ncbi:hypothetical protein E2C01_058787 [Portunus trituberculatus]|uniref:Uncharacterized protein n=1 Tax=Portunus trituberculatus TaxID=210409 RepID=A0A5B7H5P2_PORTR|nr:hypothetical protein [Portunus trituberculatus]
MTDHTRKVKPAGVTSISYLADISPGVELKIPAGGKVCWRGGARGLREGG